MLQTLSEQRLAASELTQGHLSHLIFRSSLTSAPATNVFRAPVTTIADRSSWCANWVNAVCSSSSVRSLSALTVGLITTSATRCPGGFRVSQPVGNAMSEQRDAPRLSDQSLSTVRQRYGFHLRIRVLERRDITERLIEKDRSQGPSHVLA